MAYGKVSFTSVIPQAQQILEQNTNILSTIRDVSAWYKKGASAVDFPTFASTEGEDLAFAASFTDEDPNTASDSFNMTNKLGGSFTLNDHIEHQNVLKSEELKLIELTKSIGRKASNKVVAAMIAGAASANNVSKAATGNKIVENLMDMDSALAGQGVSGQRYALLSKADAVALKKELIDSRRFDTDVKGVLYEVAGTLVIDGSDISSSILTNSIVYTMDAAAYAWGPEFVYKVIPGDSGDRQALSRAFGCKAMQGGKFISKLVAAE